MKRQFYNIAKRFNCIIFYYKTWREKGMGGLQVYEVKASIGNGKTIYFSDSYFHLSGDAPKVLEMFEIEIKRKQSINNAI